MSSKGIGRLDVVPNDISSLVMDKSRRKNDDWMKWTRRSP
jgi:hypothetical protein